MKLNTKRLVSLILVVVMSLSLLATAAFAADTTVGTDIPMDTDITREDLFIPHDVAREIAKLFLKDALSFPDINWDENTTVVNSVTMYDAEEGGDITAYTFELTEGYIVVAAYLDASNTILEWSDTAEPMYKEFKNRASSRIVYLGNLNYYEDTGEDELLTVDGFEVKRGETVNAIAETSSLTNVPADVLKNAVDYRKSAQTHVHVPVEDVIYEPIDDPFIYAGILYNEIFKAVPNDWCNKWENYMSFENGTEYALNPAIASGMHCGPMSIMVLMLSYKNRYGFSGINGISKQTLFNRIAQYGIDNNYYSPEIGTFTNTAGSYIKGAFSLYRKTVNVSTSRSITYDAVVARLRDNDLLYTKLTDHPYYGTHALICYAYCRLVGQKTGWYKTFLKVADVLTSEQGRYVDLSMASNGTFVYVDF